MNVSRSETLDQARRLRGVWLVLARAAWIIVVVVFTAVAAVYLALYVTWHQRARGSVGFTADWNEAGESIVYPLPGGVPFPADIREGDVLLAVDNQPVQPRTPVAELEDRLHGAVGSAVVLRVRHSDGSATDYTVTRVEDVGLHAHTGLGLPDGFYTIYFTALEAALFLVYLITGVIIFRYRSDDWLLLLLSLTLILICQELTIYWYLLWEAHPDWLPISTLFRIISSFGILSIFYLLPDGRFIPRWTAVPALGWTSLIVAREFFPDAPFSLSNLTEVQFQSLALTIFLTGVLAQVYRYRRVSNAIQRQQTKWIVWGLSIAVVAVYAWRLSFDVLVLNQWYWLLGRPVYILCLLGVPVSLGVAVLRYRLWNIDLLINRTLVYGVLTAIIIGIYIGVVEILDLVFKSDGNVYSRIIALALDLALFQPLRERLQRLVDRLVRGDREDTHALLTRLGRQVQTAPSPQAALVTLVETVAAALKVPYVALTMRQGDDFAVAAASGTPIPAPISYPLVYQGATVGQLLFAPRAPGQAFTPTDWSLIEEIAVQAGAVAHDAYLSAELDRARAGRRPTRPPQRRPGRP